MRIVLRDAATMRTATLKERADNVSQAVTLSLDQQLTLVRADGATAVRARRFVACQGRVTWSPS